MGSSPGGIFYTLAVSAVATLTGLTLGGESFRFSVAGVLSGALFLMMWLWLAYEAGRWPRRAVTATLCLYWLALPALVALLDWTASRRTLTGGVARLHGLGRGLLFSANYACSWLAETVLKVNLWWGAAAAGALVLFAWTMGDSCNRSGVLRRHD